MWSRFRRFAFESVVSTPKLLKHTPSICVTASLIDWIQKNNSDFKVPSFDELKTANDHHLKHESQGTTDEEDNNLRFFQKYDDVIDEYTAKLEDVDKREILTYTTQVIEQISGRYGLKNKIVVEIGSGTGIFIPAIQSAIGNNGCYIGLDISPAFIYYTNDKYGNEQNVKLNLCGNTDLKLPQELKGKVDVFFTCATYHHLQDVHAILKQIYEYMAPGGKLVVVEFKKHDHGHGHHNHDGGHKHGHGHDHKVNHDAEIMNAVKMEKDPHKLDTEWIKKHIPFTEAQAKEEIEMNGFRFERDIMRDQWNDHFVHVYRKPEFL